MDRTREYEIQQFVNSKGLVPVVTVRLALKILNFLHHVTVYLKQCSFALLYFNCDIVTARGETCAFVV